MLGEYEESLLITRRKVSDLQTFLVISHDHKQVITSVNQKKERFIV